MSDKPSLRSELMPPTLDEEKVRLLAKLAAHLDGRSPGWDIDLEEFNRVAETQIPIQEFQGIYGAEEHVSWVRRVLIKRAIRPAANVTRQELIEVIRRANPLNEFFEDHEAYMAIFDANVPLKHASLLLYYPLDYEPRTNTWVGGRPIAEYNPTSEQIVEWALSPDSRFDPILG